MDMSGFRGGELPLDQRLRGFLLDSLNRGSQVSRLFSLTVFRYRLGTVLLWWYCCEIHMGVWM